MVRHADLNRASLWEASLLLTLVQAADAVDAVRLVKLSRHALHLRDRRIDRGVAKELLHSELTGVDHARATWHVLPSLDDVGGIVARLLEDAGEGVGDGVASSEQQEARLVLDRLGGVGLAY